MAIIRSSIQTRWVFPRLIIFDGKRNAKEVEKVRNNRIDGLYLSVIVYIKFWGYSELLMMRIIDSLEKEILMSYSQSKFYWLAIYSILLYSRRTFCCKQFQNRERSIRLQFHLKLCAKAIGNCKLYIWLI